MAVVINGSGTVTGISVGGLPDDIVDAGTLANDAVGLAQMAAGTDGNIITYDASGNPGAVATGSDGQIFTSAGAGAPPTFESQPAFVMAATGTQSISSGTHTLLTLGTAVIDTVSGCTTGTSRYTVQTGYAGKYAINASVRYTDATTGQKIRLYKNASVVGSGGSGAMNYGLGTYNADLSFSCVVDLAVGDYIQVYAWNQAGGTLQADSDGWHRTSFSGYLVSV